MTEKRDTFIERTILCKEIVKLEKKIETKERKINKLDIVSFDIETKDFKPEIIKKINSVEEEIKSIELNIKQLKEKINYLQSIQTKVDIIL